jgi:hypothetical protein
MYYILNFNGYFLNYLSYLKSHYNLFFLYLYTQNLREEAFLKDKLFAKWWYFCKPFGYEQDPPFY